MGLVGGMETSRNIMSQSRPCNVQFGFTELKKKWLSFVSGFWNLFYMPTLIKAVIQGLWANFPFLAARLQHLH